VVAACSLGASSVQAALNVVQDPGFEGGETGVLTPSSTPWYKYNASGNGVVTIDSSNPHTGNFNAALTIQSAESAILFQHLTLTSGAKYAISFWIAAPGAAGSLSVNFDGSLLGSVSVAAGSVYTEYNFTATAVNSGGVISFTWSSSTHPATLDIDDVSASTTAVPEPSTMVAGALMLLPFAAGALRLRRKVSP